MRTSRKAEERTMDQVYEGLGYLFAVFLKLYRDDPLILGMFIVFIILAFIFMAGHDREIKRYYYGDK